jgi:hypothetical protein
MIDETNRQSDAEDWSGNGHLTPTHAQQVRLRILRSIPDSNSLGNAAAFCWLPANRRIPERRGAATSRTQRVQPLLQTEVR